MPKLTSSQSAQVDALIEDLRKDLRKDLSELELAAMRIAVEAEVLDRDEPANAAPTISAESPELRVHMPDPSEMSEQERERRVVRGVTLTVPTHIGAIVEGGSDE